MLKLFALTILSFITLCGCGTISTTQTNSAATSAGQQPQRFQKKLTRSVSLDYLLSLPDGYKTSGTNKWPLMIFLHGAGERGTNIDKVTVHGPPKLLKAGTNFPFIVVSPQCPDDQSWRDEDLLALLDDAVSRHNVDTNRIYLTGLSMGGFGTWNLVTKYPERFAAIAPICGGGQSIHILLASKQKRNDLKSVGVWAFHGAKDNVVPLEESQRMTNALMRAGCKDVKLTVYPDAGHDSWSQAYNDAELWKWFLAHSR